MDNLKPKKDNFIINTSTSIYLQMLMFPIFLLLIDTISAWQTNTKISFYILTYLGLPVFLLFIIGGTRIIKITNDEIIYWSYLIYKRKLQLKDIALVEVQVDKNYSQSGPSAAPSMHLIGLDSNELANFRLSTFSEKDLTLLFLKLKSINPQIKLNNRAEAMAAKNFKAISEEIKGTYFNSIYILIFVLIIGLLALGFVYLIQK